MTDTYFFETVFPSDASWHQLTTVIIVAMN